MKGMSARVLRKGKDPVGGSRRGRIFVAGTAALLLVGLGTGGCRDATGPTPAAAMEAVLPAAGEMNAQIVTMMTEAIIDEYKAEMTYRRILADFGSVRPFLMIVEAEVKHSQALATLFARYGLDTPENTFTIEEMPAFTSLTEACRAAAQAEIDNVAIYEEFFASELPEDVRLVFENLSWASQYRHLPAFQRCSGG